MTFLQNPDHYPWDTSSTFAIYILTFPHLRSCIRAFVQTIFTSAVSFKSLNPQLNRYRIFEIQVDGIKFKRRGVWELKMLKCFTFDLLPNHIHSTISLLKWYDTWEINLSIFLDNIIQLTNNSNFFFEELCPKFAHYK